MNHMFKIKGYDGVWEADTMSECHCTGDKWVELQRMDSGDGEIIRVRNYLLEPAYNTEKIVWWIKSIYYQAAAGSYCYEKGVLPVKHCRPFPRASGKTTAVIECMEWFEEKGQIVLYAGADFCFRSLRNVGVDTWYDFSKYQHQENCRGVSWKGQDVVVFLDSTPDLYEAKVNMCLNNIKTHMSPDTIVVYWLKDKV